jgi:hypothetical protein
MERSADIDERVKKLKGQIEPLWALYKEKRAAYEASLKAYDDLRIAALSTTDPQHVHEFAINSGAYRDKVKAAMDDWVMDGHKMEVEDMLARIDLMKKEQAN